MYEQMMVAVDNSSHAACASAMAVELAKCFPARIAGIHVTNAGLHSHAFRMLEGTLPDHYQQEDVLQEQRDIHGSLIGRGLNLISDSYLEQLRVKAADAGVECQTEVVEGRHFEILTSRIAGNGCDLAVFGDVGQGTDGNSAASGAIGSVLDRVARGIRKDLLVVRSGPDAPRPSLVGGARILVPVDGSENGFWALRKAIVLAKKFGAELHSVHVFDPDFHRTVFAEMAGILSREAAEVFDFEGQQELHDTVIDGGLEQVGRRYLKSCEVAAEHGGISIRTTLLRGRFYEQIVKEAGRLNANLLLLGRYGRHRVDSLDLGSTAQNVMRFAPCSVLIVSSDVPEKMKHFKKVAVDEQQESLPWTAEAEAMVMRAPDFVQKMARQSIEDWSRRQDQTEVTAENVARAMREMLPEKMWRKMLPEE